MANVYWLRGRTKDIQSNLIAKIHNLTGLPEMARLTGEDVSMALKFNLSELGYPYYLPPVIFTTLFEKMRAMGAKPVLTDSCTLFKGSRFDGYGWVDTALLQGFSGGESFDNQLLQAGGYTNEEGNFWAADGKHLAGIDIGSLLTDVQNVLVVSHVTAHPLVAMNGALHSLGAGFLTGSGKMKLHSFLSIVYDQDKCDHCGLCLPFCPTGAMSGEPGAVVFDRRTCTNCAGCFMACPHGAVRFEPDSVRTFQECVVDAAFAVKNRIRGEAFFINFLSSVTPQPDDYPFSDIPFVPDLGILASEDPVALDWATYQMIVRSPGIPGSITEENDALDKGRDKIRAITGTSPEIMIKHAEELGLGTRELEFLRGN